MVTIWLGLLSGLAEAAIDALRIFVFGDFLVMNRDFPWLVPAAAVLLFVILTPVALALRFIPRVEPAIVLGLLFTAVVGPIRAVPTLTGHGGTLLALGLAVQASRLASWRLSGLEKPARQTTLLLGSLVVLIMIGMQMSAAIAERRQLAALPPPAAGAPNVILIVLDTVRAKSTSTFGYHRSTTPTLDRLAADGVAFDRAFSTAPWTLPAHASFFTGTYPHEHGADWSRPLDNRYQTLAEALAGSGYRTAAFSANSLNVTRTHGLDRGFLHFEDLPISFGRLALSTRIGQWIAGQGTWRHWVNYHEVIDRQNAARITDNCLSWLEAGERRPFFVFLNYFDAHDPYLPPEPFATRFGPRRSPGISFWHTGFAAWPSDRRAMSPRNRQAEVDAYDGAIAYMDAQIDRLLGALESRRMLDNTLILVTSDHGEQLGEHDLFNHGNSLYRPLVHVPLVIRHPGRVPAGVRVSQPVTVKDIPRTILASVGIHTAFPGQSLDRYWSGAPPDEEIILIEATRRPFGDEPWYPLPKGNMTALVKGRYMFIRNPDDTNEVFDLETDPEELTNLADQAHAELVAEFRRLLTDRQSSTPDHRRPPMRPPPGP
jgi:arylsulfatase A-like enzyme